MSQQKALLAAFRGEHLILQTQGEIRFFPEIHLGGSETDAAIKQRFSELFGKEGEIVRMRPVGTNRFPSIRFFTSAFYGYYPADFVQMKPEEFKNWHFYNDLQHTLLLELTAWLREKEKDQARLEKELGDVLDLKPRNG